MRRAPVGSWQLAVGSVMWRAISPFALCILHFALALALTSPAHAARQPAELPGMKGMLTGYAAALERDIASRMMRRPETPPDRLERLELEIDLRIIARAIFNHAAAAPAGSDHQMHATLRGRQCLDAIAGIEAHLARQDRLTQMQSAVAKALHQLTFDVEQLKAAKDLDEFCKKLAPLVLALGTPPEVAARPLPVVRPRAVRLPPAPVVALPASARSADRTVQPPQNLSPQQMLEEARLLNLSPALRQQLIALAQAVQQPANAGEAQALRGMLVESLDMARGLQGNTAVSAEQRQQLETQLTEALVFFMDPRMRPLAQQKLAGVRQYRQFLTRLGRMSLPSEQQAQLAPLLTWARENGKTGDVALAALEGYSAARQRFDARPKQAAMAPQLKRVIDDLEKLFGINANAFLVTALELPRSASPRPADLEPRAAEMKRLAELLERMDRLPVVLDEMSSFKPRPPQALERRMIQAAVAVAASADSPARQEATRLINDLFTLHEAATRMPPLVAGDIPAAIEARWTGGRLAAVDARWRETVGELATGLAAGQPLDQAKLDRLPLAVSLYEALRIGAAMDTALAGGGEAISRWVDWRTSIADLRPLLVPYPRAVAAAFEGYVSGTSNWEGRFNRATQAYRPLAIYLYRLGAYAPQCEPWPSGVASIAACLQTAYEGAPFAQERQVALAILLWNHHNQAGNSSEADSILLSLSKRLPQE